MGLWVDLVGTHVRADISQDSFLSSRMIMAIPQAVIHHRALCAFTESLRVEFEPQLVTWEKDVLLWEADKSRYCPYELPEPRKPSLAYGVDSS